METPPFTPTWEKAGIDKAVFDRLPPEERLKLERTHNPRPPEQRRPTMRTLSPAELESIKDLPFHERHTKGREMQQTPAPEAEP